MGIIVDPKEIKVVNTSTYNYDIWRLGYYTNEVLAVYSLDYKTLLFCDHSNWVKSTGMALLDQAYFIVDDGDEPIVCNLYLPSKESGRKFTVQHSESGFWKNYISFRLEPGSTVNDVLEYLKDVEVRTIHEPLEEDEE